MKRFALGLIAGTMLVGCASAQNVVPSITPPAGPCDGEGYHQFDFWIGDWDVTDPESKPQGSNLITREESSCLLVEHWTSVGEGTGQSYNFYNPDTKQWRQVWVSSGSLIDYTGGLTETGSMKLEGTITGRTGKPSASFTGEWTLNEDGSVTQHFEQYDPEADVWNDWFTGIYRKKEG